MEVSMSKTRRGKYTDNRICYISKCKGDMRLYLRRKGKLPCFSYLVRGKSFSFYRGKIRIFYQRAYTYFSEVITFIGVFYPLYLNTLTISLSPPTSWLHRFSIPVSEKPHFSITLPEAGFPVKWSAQMFSICFSLMQ